MKKCSSIVWRFFDRIENESKRCLAVLCKLCDTQYKFFGNTTNLRSHLINKHPLQWELGQNGTLDETNFRIEDDESNQSAVSPKRKKYSRSYKDKNIDVLEASDIEHDNRDNEESEATFNLVRQLRENNALQGSDEEWLEDEQYQTTYEPKRKKVTYRKIKREVQTPPRRLSYRPVKYDKPPVVIENNILRDEYSVFGEYVANKLRKFKAPRTRGNLQQLITTILWQAEYGTYDNADSVKRVLMCTVQEPQPEQSTPEFETVQVQAEEVIEQRDLIPNQTNQSIEMDG
ncbi:uncharacterized protein ACR2FA_003787 isoform 2-T2 [Aphomia sociella]